MEVADFRRLALALEGAEEGSHMGAADFRVGGRIFATLAAQSQGYGNLMITPEMQAEFARGGAEGFSGDPWRMGTEWCDACGAGAGQRGVACRGIACGLEITQGEE